MAVPAGHSRLEYRLRVPPELGELVPGDPAEVDLHPAEHFAPARSFPCPYDVDEPAGRGAMSEWPEEYRAGSIRRRFGLEAELTGKDEGIAERSLALDDFLPVLEPGFDMLAAAELPGREPGHRDAKSKFGHDGLPGRPGPIAG